jgi:hypothetical protein
MRHRADSGATRSDESSAKNPPKGKFVKGVFYVAAKAATHKATEGGGACCAPFSWRRRLAGFCDFAFRVFGFKGSAGVAVSHLRRSAVLGIISDAYALG